MKYSGHETFVCRYAWLTKAATEVLVDASILTANREDDAMSVLGVGKNMVKSIRFWAEAADIIEPDGDEGHQVTDFGKTLLCGVIGRGGRNIKPLDPYLEDVQTLWLIHWKLATNQKSLIFSWDFLLSRFQEPELYTASVIRAFEKELAEVKISRGSMEQLWDVFLHSYVPTRGNKGEVKEDTLDCPLVELDLLIPVGFAGSARHSGKPEPKYAFRREEKPEIGSHLFSYCLGEFWKNFHAEEKSIPLHLVANGHGGPGQVFKIPEADIRNRLLPIEESSNGAFAFDESEAIPRIRRNEKTSMPSLEHIYE